MCEQSLVNYLATELGGEVAKEDFEKLIKSGENVIEHEATYVAKKKDNPDYKGLYEQILPKSIEKFAKEIDEKLATIKVCDPAFGSGAFPVGMMNTIVKARMVLSSYLKDKNRTLYTFKRDCIQNSLYGVDIDPGAVEIAKLRLWLSLVVDEDDIKQIKPLPNLDYKIMQGNSLLEEFEGIRLFDEKIITSVDTGKNKQIEALKQRQSTLQSEFFELHASKKLTAAKKAGIEDELAKIHAQLKKLHKSETAGVENDNLFSSHSEEKKKADELKRLQKEFFEATQKSKKDSIKKQIEQLEWELIEATLKEQNKISALKKLDQFKKSNVKPFFLWRLNFAEVFEEKGGFDVIIANPPYVSHDKIKEKEVLKTQFSVYEPFADLYCYFLEIGVRLQNPRGTICFITSNSYLRADYGRPLRDFLSEKNAVLAIINIEDFQIFDTAIVNTAVLISERRDKKDEAKCIVVNTSYDNRDSFDRFVEQNKFPYTQQEFRAKAWYLLTPSNLALKKKIESGGQSLESIGTKIRMGIATG